MKGKELLDHVEKIQDDYEVLVDKIPTEDKLIASREEEFADLEPWEISEIVQESLNNLPERLEEHIDIVFDIVYAAVAKAVDRIRGEVC